MITIPATEAEGCDRPVIQWLSADRQGLFYMGGRTAHAALHELRDMARAIGDADEAAIMAGCFVVAEYAVLSGVSPARARVAQVFTAEELLDVLANDDLAGSLVAVANAATQVGARVRLAEVEIVTDPAAHAVR